MTAKEYLKQYEEADRKVRKLRSEYETKAALVDAVRSLSDNDGMPHGSGISNPTERKAIELAEKKRRLTEALLEAVRIRQEIFDFVLCIPGIEGDVLYERYVNLRKWEEICVTLHYSWHGIHAVHRRALAIAERALNGTMLM